MIIIKIPKYTEEEMNKFDLLPFDNYPDALEIASSFEWYLHDIKVATVAKVNIHTREVYLTRLKHQLNDFGAKPRYGKLLTLKEQQKIARDIEEWANSAIKELPITRVRVE